jgi:hypothetical protein
MHVTRPARKSVALASFLAKFFCGSGVWRRLFVTDISCRSWQGQQTSWPHEYVTYSLASLACMRRRDSNRKKLVFPTTDRVTGRR